MINLANSPLLPLITYLLVCSKSILIYGPIATRVWVDICYS